MIEQRRTQANSKKTQDELPSKDKRSWHTKLVLFSFGLLDIVIRWAVREVSSALETQFGTKGRSPKRRRRT